MSTPRSQSRSFSTILVANRGEIALRIIRTARALGYRTVAVYSTADADALHVKAADKAIPIGEPSPRKSYLNIQRIMDAARQAGADAIHPGYGFLSENADFAQACADAGLVFIGPSSESIRRMGDKAAAKVEMRRAGLPCIPGYDGEDQSEERLSSEADRIGFPVMIKAVAGGGGRGMRKVDEAGAFLPALRSAVSEASAAFADGRVLLEKAIVEPRHIEVQVFGDSHGNAIHLGERDCSVQRRHQKVIEEAPSPFLTPALRERIGRAATEAVKALAYEGAGTIEFLVAPDQSFYFMEMNTRLQVEHPVTEEITGLDLVALQLKVASGAPLGITQDEIAFNGHAIEIRLCAEDPSRNFTPQSGTIALWDIPAGPRVETGVQTGSVVSPYYDSMIAKIIAHGATREEARRKLVRALDTSAILGLTTNRVFLRQILAHPAFADGDVTTGFIAIHKDDLFDRPASRPETCWVIAGILALIANAHSRGAWSTHALMHSFPIPLRIAMGDDPVDITAVHRGGGAFEFAVGDSVHSVTVHRASPNRLELDVDGVGIRIAHARSATGTQFNFEGNDYEFSDMTFMSQASGETGVSDGLLRASLTGKVVAIHAGPADALKPGQQVLTLEAMKMEHTQTASGGGRLVEVLVKVGDQVSSGQILARLESHQPPQ